MSKIKFFEKITSWTRVLNAARRTIGKEPLSKEPSDSWKAKILLAEHSPIRLLEFDWGWEEIKQWVSVHLVRHHTGCEKFVHSQRGDRRGLGEEYDVKTRDELPQGAPNDMDMTANAQAMINISRKRLCIGCASKETREAWIQVIDALRKSDPILADKCVPECLYRGFCPEWMSTCNYCKSDAYKIALVDYRNTDYTNDWRDLELDGYQINQRGKIRCLNDNGEEIFLKMKIDTESGYGFYMINDMKVFPHLEVARIFVDGYNESTEDVIHIDGNKINNHKNNLRVV